MQEIKLANAAAIFSSMVKNTKADKSIAVLMPPITQ